MKPIVPEYLHPRDCKGLPEDIEIMRKILQYKPDSLERLQREVRIDGGTRTIMPPLHVACELLHVDCVQFLLEAGAKLNLECPDGKSALYYAVLSRGDNNLSEDCIKIVKLLLKSRLPDQKLYTHDHSLFYDVIVMIQNNLNAAVKLMLEYGEVSANVKELDPEMLERNSPLVASIESKNIDAMKLLILHGAKVANYKRYGHGKFSIPCYIVQFYDSASINAISALKIFQNFGGNLWTPHTRFIGDELQNQTALELLRQEPQGTQYVKGVDVELERMMKNPLGLQNLCRLALWKVMGEKYWCSIDNLEVPVELKDFLRLGDIKIVPPTIT